MLNDGRAGGEARCEHDEKRESFYNPISSMNDFMNSAAKGTQMEFPYPRNLITRASPVAWHSAKHGSPLGTIPRENLGTNGLTPDSTRRDFPSAQGMRSKSDQKDIPDP